MSPILIGLIVGLLSGVLTVIPFLGAAIAAAVQARAMDPAARRCLRISTAIAVRLISI